MKTDVVVGLQYGDEGKGKAAAYLASKFNYDLVCRANGGPNAGHTVVTDKGKTFKLSQLPGASPYCNTVYIGAGCVISISKLVEEIEILRAYKPSFKVMIHKNTHVIMEHHVEQDIKLEETYNIGTTKKGIGPCYAEAALRTGETIDNVLNNLNFSEGYVNALRDFTEDGHVSIITGLYVDARSVLVEMSQGYELDPFIGNYPYVTSSSSHPGFACASLNIPTQAIRSIYGVLKPYVTYVGGDESFKDMDKNLADKIRKLGKEFGVVTGRPRRIGDFNFDRIQEAIKVYGVCSLFLNKMDIIDKIYPKNTYKQLMSNYGLPILYGYGPKTSDYKC